MELNFYVSFYLGAYNPKGLLRGKKIMYALPNIGDHVLLSEKYYKVEKCLWLIEESDFSKTHVAIILGVEPKELM